MVRQIKAVLCIVTALGSLMRCSGYHDIFPVTVGPTHIYYVNRNSTAAISDGKQDSPFKSIQTAIENAYLNGTPAEVRVATGTYNEPVILRNGVSLYGGYDASFTNRNTATYISTITTPTSTAVYADASISVFTVIDGFTIKGGPLTGITHGIYINGSKVTVSNNTITGGAGDSSAAVYNTGSSSATITRNTIQGGTGSTDTVGISVLNSSTPTIVGSTISGGNGATSKGFYIDAGSAPRINGNTLHGGYSTSRSYGVDSRGTPTITNNVIYGGNGLSSCAIANNGSPVISNNVLHAGTGANSDTSVIYSNSASYPTVTNNLFVANGAIQMAFFEQTTIATARSLENNAFWDFNSASTLTVYYNCTAGSCSGPDIKTAIAPIESLTDWPGGSDKARGNLLLSAGASGNPFVNVPQFWDRTNAAGTTTTFATSQFGKYANGDYVEFNGDGIAHQITGCAAICASSPITFTTALSSATTASMEVRNWGNKSLGGSQYAIDYHLSQNSLAGSVWNNLRYGGKNTAGTNCGAPSAGVGTGSGGESCGTVTADKDGNLRTTDNAAVATNNTVPNAAAGATASVPGGFSIGAYERD